MKRMLVVLFMLLALVSCVGGGNCENPPQPIPSPTPTPTVSPTPTPTPTASPTVSPTPIPTQSPTPPVSPSPLSIGTSGTIPIISGALNPQYAIPVYNNSDEDLTGISYGYSYNSANLAKKLNQKSSNSLMQFLTSVFTPTPVSDCSQIPAHHYCLYSITDSQTIAMMNSNAQGSFQLIANYGNSRTANQVVNFQNVSSYTTDDGVDFSSGATGLQESSTQTTTYNFLTIYLYNNSASVFNVESLSSTNPNISILPSQAFASLPPHSAKPITIMIAGNADKIPSFLNVVSGSSSHISSTNSGLASVNDAQLEIGIPPIINSDTQVAPVALFINNVGTTSTTIGHLSLSTLEIVAGGTCQTGRELAAKSSCSLLVKAPVKNTSGVDILRVGYSGGVQAEAIQTISWMTAGKPLANINVNPQPAVFYNDGSATIIANITNMSQVKLMNPMVSGEVKIGAAIIESITALTSSCTQEIVAGANCKYQVLLRDATPEYGQIGLILSAKYSPDNIFTQTAMLNYQAIDNVSAANLSISSNMNLASIVGDSLQESTITFTLTNTGTRSADISAKQIQSSDNSLFTQIADNCGSTLNINSNCAISYRFGPTSSYADIAGSASFIATYGGGKTPAGTLAGTTIATQIYSRGPKIISVTPSNNSISNTLNPMLLFTFDSAMDPTTIGSGSGVSAGNLWLEDSYGNIVTQGYVCAPTVCNDAYTVWIAPNFGTYSIPNSQYYIVANPSQIKNISGESMGTSTRQIIATFKTLNTQPNFSSLALGFNSMAIESSGSAYMWGWYNGSRKFGTPLLLNTNLKFSPSTLVSTYQTTCAKSTTDGETYCWGSDSYHALGRGVVKPTEENTQSPVIPVWGNHNFKSLAAGTNFACGIDQGGVAWCWGENNCGQMGFANPSNSCTTYPPSHDGGWGVATPGVVPGQSSLNLTFSSIYAGALSVCAITTESEAYCWGQGVGASGGYSVVPVLIGGGHKFKKLAMYDSVAVGTCGLDYDGKLWCWSSSTSLPVEQVTPNNVSLTDFALGNSHICALDLSGNMYCQGSNNNGQYGNGNTTYSATFISSAGGMQFKILSAGINYTCGVTLTNLNYCWGGNNWGSIGNAPLTDGGNYLTPQLVYGILAP